MYCIIVSMFSKFFVWFFDLSLVKLFTNKLSRNEMQNHKKRFFELKNIPLASLRHKTSLYHAILLNAQKKNFDFNFKHILQ